MISNEQELYDLRTEANNWLSKLEFMKDEQVFLEHLLSSHFLDLSTEKLYEPTRKLIRKLKDVEAIGTELLREVQRFNHKIVKAVERKSDYAENTLINDKKNILKDFETYVLKFRYVKKKIFAMIKDIMLHHKQKLLINKT